MFGDGGGRELCCKAMAAFCSDQVSSDCYSQHSISLITDYGGWVAQSVDVQLYANDGHLLVVHVVYLDMQSRTLIYSCRKGLSTCRKVEHLRRGLHEKGVL
jgi:hypothetical protein